MAVVPSPAAGRFFTAWSPDALGVLLPLLLVLAYAVPLVGQWRAGRSWPPWRVVCHVTAVLVLVWALNGAPAAYRGSYPWLGALSVGLVTAVVPLGVALGDPVGLWERATGRSARWLRGRVARAVMFPLVASVVSATLLTVAFTSGWYPAARVHAGPWAALQLSSFVVGLVVNLPLLSEDLLPVWCGPGLRTLLAFADGLFDAVPGVVVMTTVERFTGGALLAVAESVGVPMIFAVMATWVRSDEAEAKVVDARLDAAAGDRSAELQRPWWESDPQLSQRFRPPDRDH